jgi:hypothetical protein
MLERNVSKICASLALVCDKSRSISPERTRFSKSTNSQEILRFWQTRMLWNLVLVKPHHPGAVERPKVVVGVVVALTIKRHTIEPLRSNISQGELITIENGVTTKRWREEVSLLPEDSVMLSIYLL